MSDLLPCPFCGNSAEIHHDDSSDYPSHWSFMVICQTADCVEGSRFKTEGDAAAAWNRRAALSQDTHSLPLKPQEAVKPAVETPQAPAAGTNSTRSALSVGSDGSPSTLSSEAGGAKMEGGSSASPDRAAKAGMHSANSEQAVTDLEAE
jgi:hypothetical protein